MTDLTALVETVAAAEWERQKGTPWVDLDPIVQHAAREAILPLVTATAAAMRETLAAERDVLEAIVARVEALADEWAAMGCDSSDDTHPPTPSRMCPSCASADLHAACADEREWRADEEDR